MNETFVTITSAAAGNDQDGFRVGYYWDGRTFGTKPGAVSNGFKLVRCDDFNIGVVRKGELVSLWWMDECLSEDAETLDRISVECGLAW